MDSIFRLQNLRLYAVTFDRKLQIWERVQNILGQLLIPIGGGSHSMGFCLIHCRFELQDTKKAKMAREKNTTMGSEKKGTLLLCCLNDSLWNQLCSNSCRHDSNGHWCSASVRLIGCWNTTCLVPLRAQLSFYSAAKTDRDWDYAKQSATEPRCVRTYLEEPNPFTNLPLQPSVCQT